LVKQKSHKNRCIFYFEVSLTGKSYFKQIKNESNL